MERVRVGIEKREREREEAKGRGDWIEIYMGKDLKIQEEIKESVYFESKSKITSSGSFIFH